MPPFVCYFESDGAPALLTPELARNVATVVRMVLPRKRRSARSSTMAGESVKRSTVLTSLDFADVASSAKPVKMPHFQICTQLTLTDYQAPRQSLALQSTGTVVAVVPKGHREWSPTYVHSQRPYSLDYYKRYTHVESVNLRDP